MTKKILVTGGQGFIGSHIAQMAFHQGYDVTSFDIKNAQDTPYKSLQGDILDHNALAQAFADQDYVIHSAANPNLWSRSKKRLYQVNHMGTLNVIKACQQNHIKTLIHISSDCTLISKKNKRLSENSKTSLNEMKGAYCKSKWLAEKAVIEANTQDLKTMVLNPGVPIGATVQEAPFTQMLDAFLQGKVKGYLRGQIALIDVQDIATMVLQALEHGQGAKRYLAVSQVLSIRDLFHLMGRFAQVKSPNLCVPFWLAKTAAYFEQSFALLSGSPPLATLAGIHLARYTPSIDTHWTQQQLQVQFKNIEPALASMIRQRQSKPLKS